MRVLWAVTTYQHPIWTYTLCRSWLSLSLLRLQLIGFKLLIVYATDDWLRWHNKIIELSNVRVASNIRLFSDSCLVKVLLLSLLATISFFHTLHKQLLLLQWILVLLKDLLIHRRCHWIASYLLLHMNLCWVLNDTGPLVRKLAVHHLLKFRVLLIKIILECL